MRTTPSTMLHHTKKDKSPMPAVVGEDTAGPITTTSGAASASPCSLEKVDRVVEKPFAAQYIDVLEATVSKYENGCPYTSSLEGLVASQISTIAVLVGELERNRVYERSDGVWDQRVW